MKYDYGNSNLEYIFSKLFFFLLCECKINMGQILSELELHKFAWAEGSTLYIHLEILVTLGPFYDLLMVLIKKWSFEVII